MFKYRFGIKRTDATLVSVPSITLDPGDLRTMVQDKRAETEEGACRLERKEGEATKTSNWVLVEGLFILFCYLKLFYVIFH